jgi:hypothetical protein
MAIWPDLMKAWADVEMNASKCSFGVLQCLWDETVKPVKKTGKGADATGYEVYDQTPFKFRSVPPKNFYPVYRTFDKPNDFIEIYRFDPGRLVDDLERTYGVNLYPDPLFEPRPGYSLVDVLNTADLVEYWTEEHYCLIAKTTLVVAPKGRSNRAVDYEEMPRYVLLSAGPNPCAPDFPFWVLQNVRVDPNENPTTLGSIADTDDIIGLNKHYNEINSEEASEIAINIHSPLVYMSDEHTQNPSEIRFAPGATIPIGAEEKLEKLAWQGEPTVVPQHLDRIMRGMLDLTFLGEAGVGRLPSGISGLGMQIALHPLQQINELKLPLRVAVLESVCAYLLKTFEKKSGAAPFRKWFQKQAKRFELAELKAEDIDGDYYCAVVYGNLLPRDDLASEQNEVYKFKTGTQSLYDTLDRLGYDDPESGVERLKAELQDPVLNPEKVILIAQAKAASQQQQPQQGQQPQPQPGQPQGQQQPTPQLGQQGQLPMLAGPEQGTPFGRVQLPTGPLPGTAQPGTAPVVPGSLGGRRGAPPPVPGPAAQQGGPGPGQTAPFLRRP